MALPPLPASLGHQVTTRQFSLLEMASREWGSSFRAPDHRIYNFSNGRSMDSTDTTTNGIYQSGVLDLLSESAVTPGTGGPLQPLQAENAGATGDPFLIG